MSGIREVQLLRVCRSCMVALALLGAVVITGKAQSTSSMLATDAALNLPDAPGESSSLRVYLDSPANAQAASGSSSAPQHAMASTTDMYILPGQQAPRLTAGNKFVMGVKDSVSPFSMVGWVASALYAQALNGAPNYGSNGKAFAQRLGASAARASAARTSSATPSWPRSFTKTLATTRWGAATAFVKRTVYAATRTIITRTDDGRTTPNLLAPHREHGGCRTY